MFGLGKSKTEKFKAEVASRIAEGGKQIDLLIQSQIDFGIEHFDTDIEETWYDPYTRYYVYGAYDALTCDFPIEIRQKIGPSIIEIGFIRCAQKTFELSEESASQHLDAVFTFHRKHLTYPAIMDGGVDGNEARQGRPGLRLLANLFDNFQNPEY